MSFPYIKFCALGVSPELPNSFLPIPIDSEVAPQPSPTFPNLAPNFLNAVPFNTFPITPPAI